MIVFEDVTKLYDQDVVGLQDSTCHIGKGEFVFVVGPSGSGKSTLIRMVLKELEPTQGRILVAGRNLATLSRRPSTLRPPVLRRSLASAPAVAAARPRIIEGTGRRAANRAPEGCQPPVFLRLARLVLLDNGNPPFFGRGRP